MKFPISFGEWRGRRSLQMDPEHETLSIVGETGEIFGTMSWDTLIEYLQGKSRRRINRNYPRTLLGMKVSFLTPEGRLCESLTSNVGGGGLFVEYQAAPHVGTGLMMKLCLPDDLTTPLHARGTVAWMRSERVAGMGVQFTDIPTQARHRLVRMVTSLEAARMGKKI